MMMYKEDWQGVRERLKLAIESMQKQLHDLEQGIEVNKHFMSTAKRNEARAVPMPAELRKKLQEAAIKNMEDVDKNG